MTTKRMRLHDDYNDTTEALRKAVRRLRGVQSAEYNNRVIDDLRRETGKAVEMQIFPDGSFELFLLHQRDTGRA